MAFPRLFFDHIPKTGGTSLHQYLEHIYGRENVSPALKEFRVSAAMAEYEGCRVISGHFSPFFGDFPSAKWKKITVLRDPIDRLLSLFFFYKHDSANSTQPDIQLAQKVDLDTFLTGNPGDSFTNFMVNHYSTFLLDPSVPATDAEKLKSAKQVLDLFDVVGVFHEFDEVPLVLGAIIGLPFSGILPHARKTSHRAKLSDLGSTTLKRLHELNALDLELYDYATDLYRQQRRKALIVCCDQRSITMDKTAVRVATVESKPAAISQIDTPVFRAKRIEFGTRDMEITEIYITGIFSVRNVIMTGESSQLIIHFRSHIATDNLTLGIQIRDHRMRMVYGTNTRILGYKLTVIPNAEYDVALGFRNDLGPGQYSVAAALHDGYTHTLKCYHWLDEACVFEVSGNIGNHFEGYTKLHPQITVHAAVSGVPSALISMPREISSAPQLLGRLNDPLIDFSARMTLLSKLPNTLSPGQVVALDVDLMNQGGETWPAIGNHAVYVSYHWQTDAGDDAQYDGERTALPTDLPSQRSMRVWVTVYMPRQPGEYHLKLSLVQEEVAWFDGCGQAILPDPVRVEIA